MNLGPGHALLLNYFIRHDGSTDFPKSWVVQVRTAGETEEGTGGSPHDAEAHVRVEGAALI